MNHSSYLFTYICLIISCVFQNSVRAHSFPTGHTFSNLSFPFDANLIQTFYQDEQGMMWMGTRKGLFSYDGNLLRLHMDKPDDDNGSGIGLYLVKKFIEMHQGSVEAKNRQGLVVTLSLPLKGENLPTTSPDLTPESKTNDLENAAKVQPQTASARGRITQGTALAALGRIALYNEKWDEAITAYKQIIQSGCYSLFPDYSTLFKEENEGCNEIIFGIRYEGPGLEEGSSIGGHWDTPLEAMNGTIDLADAFYHLDGKPTTDKTVCAYNSDVSADLWNLNTARYENRDPRLRATLFIPGMAWNDKNWYYGGAAASYSTIYVMKYFNPALNWSTSWDDGQDFYVFRYAEVLLSLAEAYIEKGANFDEAVLLINQVRARAGMPSVENVEGSGLSQAALRDVVRHERRVELAFEGLRLFDLYRWHTLKEAVDSVNQEAATYNFWYEHRNYRGEQEYQWPIPQTELDCNAQLTQNELW